MSDFISDEVNAIHQSEIMLAQHIRAIVIADINSGKFNDFELAGRLGRTRVGVEAMKTRHLWTLPYAITIARKLGYSLGTLEVISNA